MAVNNGVGGFNSSASKILGQDGVKLVNGTSSTAIAGCYCIYFYEDSTINTLQGDKTSSLASEVLPAGTYLFGNFNTIQLTNGACICYGVDGSI